MGEAALSDACRASVEGLGTEINLRSRIPEGIETPLQAVSIADLTPPVEPFQTQLTPSALATATRPRYRKILRRLTHHVSPSSSD